MCLTVSLFRPILRSLYSYRIFFVEIKPPEQSAAVLRRQAIYDGAFGARAMHHVKAYGAEETFDGNAYTLTSTYINGQLEILAHYLTAPDGPGQPPHYRVVSIKKHILDDQSDMSSFLSGLTAFRNARDFMREQRETFIADANQGMRSCSPEARENYINSATQRIQDIIKRNGSFASAASTSQEDAPEGEQLTAQEEIDADAESDVTVTPARQLRSRLKKQAERYVPRPTRKPRQPQRGRNARPKPK